MNLWTIGLTDDILKFWHRLHVKTQEILSILGGKTMESTHRLEKTNTSDSNIRLFGKLDIKVNVCPFDVGF